jgi:kumamolisin
MRSSEFLPLPKSGRKPASGAVSIADTSPTSEIEITVRIRSRQPLSLAERLQRAGELGCRKIRDRENVKREEYAHTYGADPADIEAVRQFAKQYHLGEVGSSAGGRSLRFKGSVSNMNRAFGITLRNYKYPFGQYMGREGSLFLPADLIHIVQGVFGLDGRRQSKPFITKSLNASPSVSDNTIDTIMQNYAFPESLDGAGQCIGILEFGGALFDDDAAKYFQYRGKPKPDISFKNAGAVYTPNIDLQADQEVALDVEVAGSLAPKAKIRVYSAPNTEKGWIDAVSAAIHDAVDEPSVIAISWGSAEGLWEQDKQDALTELFLDAVWFGVTVCIASGDDGWAIDSQGFATVNFPASHPLVLACGGTQFCEQDEVVWNERGRGSTGGGISDIMTRAFWQPSITFPPPVPPKTHPTQDGRLLPDVAGLASCCYCIYVDCAFTTGIGGTSAVPPIWAALIARFNQYLSDLSFPRLGFFLPLLYGSTRIQATFNDITSGNNDPNGCQGYRSGQNWDACTGWGSPNGNKLLIELLRAPSVRTAHLAVVTPESGQGSGDQQVPAAVSPVADYKQAGD